MSTDHWNMTGAARIAALASLALIVYASLYPFGEWNPVPADLGQRMLAASRSPQITDIAGNLLFYAPSGFLLALGFRGRGRLLALAALPLLSLGLEVAQASLPGRTTSLLDIIMNTLGAAGGATAALVGRDLFRRLPALIRQRLRTDPVGRACLIALALWALAALTPFIPTIEIGHVRDSLASLVNSPLRSLSVTGLLQNALALLIAVLLARRASVSASRVAAPLGMAGLVLVAQIAVVSHNLTLEIALGTALGAALALAWPVWRGHWLHGLLIATALTHLLLDWHPPTAETRTAMNLIPFLPQLSNPLYGLADILHGMWPYAVFTTGVFGLARRERRGAAAGVVISGLIAGALELSQTATSRAYADITDIITAVAGAACVLAALPRRQLSEATPASDHRSTDLSFSRRPGNGKPPE